MPGIARALVAKRTIALPSCVAALCITDPLQSWHAHPLPGHRLLRVASIGRARLSPRRWGGLGGVVQTGGVGGLLSRLVPCLNQHDARKSKAPRALGAR